MSDFLSNLVERSFSPTSTVRPQLLSIFEPPSINGGAFFRGNENRELSAAEQHHQEPADRLSRLRSLWRTTTSAPATQFVATLSNAGLTSPESTELLSASPQTRTRGDLPGKQQTVAPSRTRRATDDGARKDEVGAASLRPQLPSEHTPSPSSANKPVPHDSTKNRPHELGAKKIVEMIAPERDQHRELIQVRDVHLVSRQPPSPRVIAPVRQSNIAPVRQPKNTAIPPSINVTIGRVEIRAMSPVPAAPRPRPKSAHVLSLEEYLRRRASGGSR
jgi:hypothetical protein